MDMARCSETIEQALADMPMLDAHTHIVGDHLGAKGLHDVLLYHMAVSDLYAAGCPSGARLTQYPGWPDQAEARRRISEAVPYLPRVQHTSISWGIRIILQELYGWTEDVTASNWEKLDARIRERADDRAWHREIVGRAGVERICTEIARRESGRDDDLLQYALEWAFFTRCQWGEFDTALYELEKCWGRLPESPTPIGEGKRPETERVIRSVDDVHAAVEWYVSHIPADRIISTATHISTDINLDPPSTDEMVRALSRRSQAGAAERDIYAGYINELFLTRFEQSAADRVVFQFSFGAEPLPFETASRLEQRTIRQVAEMIGRHPRVRFQCFLASAYANQSMCTLCRELPNLALVGFWWHNFFPAIIHRVIHERIDMLPTNRQIGFFSDAYCVEWMYAKTKMVKRVLAHVLAEKVMTGQFSTEMAIDFARRTLHGSAQELLGMTPAQVK